MTGPPANAGGRPGRRTTSRGLVWWRSWNLSIGSSRHPA